MKTAALALLSFFIFQNPIFAETALARNFETNDCSQLLTTLRKEHVYIGYHPLMADALRKVEMYADRNFNFLITGESGTGKEIIAQAIRSAQPAGKPFVAVNVSALNPALIESELFGHIKGSFTGAEIPRNGAFRQANGGILFLDEIGDLPMELQVKLLRVLSTGEVYPVGADQPVKVKVKVLAATNQDLGVKIQQGAFRKDLYYRLRQASIQLPPLRERQEEIPSFSRKLLRKIEKEHGVENISLAPGGAELLKALSWDGNVRELESVLSLAATRSEIITEDTILSILPLGSFELPRVAQDLVNYLSRQIGRVPPQLSDKEIEDIKKRQWPDGQTLIAYLKDVLNDTPRDEVVYDSPLARESRGQLLETGDAYHVYLHIPRNSRTLNAMKRALEKLVFKHVLKETDGQAAAAAKILEVDNSTLYRRLVSAGIHFDRRLISRNTKPFDETDDDDNVAFQSSAEKKFIEYDDGVELFIPFSGETRALQETLAVADRTIISYYLEKNDQNMAQTAAELRVPAYTISRRVKAWDVK